MLEANATGQKITINGEKAVFVTVLDPHFSPVTPSSRSDDFLAATLDAFDQAVRLAVRVKADGIIIAGDIFHLKTGSRNTHAFMKVVIDTFLNVWKQGIPILVVAGNHDLTFGSLVSLESQPIGVLVAAGAVHLLDHNSVLFESPKFTVRVAGASYDHAKAEGVRDLKAEGATHLVSVGHFWFGPETGEFFGEPVYGPAYFKDSEASAFVIGHHHADQGIPEVGGKLFFSHGSMNRVGSHRGDMERKPSVGLLTVTEEGVTGRIARLKVADADTIFIKAQVKVLQEEKEELDQFMALIAQQITTATDVPGILEELALSQEVRTRVEAYLKSAEEAAA